MENNNITLSVILPCHNEEEGLGDSIKQIKKIFVENQINGEIIVSDSSTDKSPEIAKELGVTLLKHNLLGYGRAYLEGFTVAQGEFLFLADPDGSYDFREIPKFLKYLKEDNDFIIGNRFGGKIEKGAMPWSHKYIGNPLLSGLLRMFFQTNIRDIHCGMRAINKKALNNLNLKTTGMEFASEMLVEALGQGLKIKEVAINYHPRKGKSKLKPLVDGWRHLRLILLYSPLLRPLISENKRNND